ncbi:MAG TPA: hypothetical protein VGF76_02610 [Polyangiaceae bacterium]
MLFRTNSRTADTLSFESWVLLLVAFALPRSTLPGGLALACTAFSWIAFASSLLARAGRAQLLWQLVAGAALAALAVSDPPLWLAVATCLSLVALAILPVAAARKYRISLGVGLLAPAALYGALFAVGTDERVALRMAFRVDSSPGELASAALSLLLVVSLSVLLLGQFEPAQQRSLRPLCSTLGSLVVCGLLAKLACIATVATLPGDLKIWSEAPALTNLLKLHAGEPFYGPIERVNSHAYSPGLELTQYALLRPFQLELSLRAHRVLGLLWQLLSAAVLGRALWPWLSARLRPALGGFAFPALLITLANVTLSSLLAPHLHPDHLLMLCFSAALALCLRPDPFGRRDWLALALLPMVATVFKLTGAGIGIGLGLAVLFERRWMALVSLGVGAVLALATIPLFDATLGQFSLYAIRLQASPTVFWGRLAEVPSSAPGLIFIVSLLAVAGAAWAGVARANVRAAARCLWLTLAFGLPSVVAYCRLGGRSNSLLPLTIGGSVALFTLLGDTSSSLPAASATPGKWRVVAPLLLVMFWVAFSTGGNVDLVVGDSRRQLLTAHAREVAWLRGMFARGLHPLSQGMAAWLEVGRRDVPLDRLNSASDLDLVHQPNGFERRLLNGTYDGLYLSASSLHENPLLVRLRGPLSSRYRVVEPADLHGAWPSEDGGYVILERR